MLGMFKNPNKNKGITVRFIIIIIIAVISLAIIIALLANFPGRGIIDKETCHQSVLLRSMPSAIGKSLKESIRLNCKTEEILISYGEEDEINERIANAMYDCWWMLGEGKLDFMPEKWTKETYCVICSTIDFTDKVKSQRKEVDGFVDYINYEKIPGKNTTYSEYLFGKEPEIHLDESFVFNTDTKYAVIYSASKAGWIRQKGWFLAQAALGIGAAIAAPFTGGSTIAIFTVRAISTAVGARGAFLAFFTGTSGGDVIFSIIPYKAEAIETFGCTELENIP